MSPAAVIAVKALKRTALTAMDLKGAALLHQVCQELANFDLVSKCKIVAVSRTSRPHWIEHWYLLKLTSVETLVLTEINCAMARRY